MKHTPGPWGVCKYNGPYDYYTDNLDVRGEAKRAVQRQANADGLKSHMKRLR